MLYYYFILISIALCFAHIIYHYLRSRQRNTSIDKIPGPKGYPLIGNAADLGWLNAGSKLRPYLETNRKIYGPLFRIWIGHLPIVVISNPYDAKKLLSSSIDRPPLFHHFLKQWIAGSVAALQGSAWHNRKKLLLPIFHQQVLERFIPTMFESCQKSFSKLSGMENKEVDILSFVSKCTLRQVCETIMGVKFDENSMQEQDYEKGTAEMFLALNNRSSKPWLWTDFCYSFSNASKREKKASEMVRDLSLKIIKEKKEERAKKYLASAKADDNNVIPPKKQRKALLDFLLDIQEEEGSCISDEDIRAEVNTFVIAGSHTTGLIAALAVFFIGIYPAIQEKVQKELESVFQNSNRVPTMSDLNQLKYLESVIKETLRIISLLPVITRYTTENIELGGGFVIPPDTTVVVDWSSMQHDQAYYANPHQFDPNHFSPEQTQTRHEFAYLAFGAPPRSCIGRKFAIMDIKIFLFSLLRKYQVQSLQTLKEMNERFYDLFNMHDNIIIKIISRNEEKLVSP